MRPRQLKQGLIGAFVFTAAIFSMGVWVTLLT
jgi:hypothetical protein